MTRDVHALERSDIDSELRLLARKIRDELAMVERWGSVLSRAKVIAFRQALDHLLGLEEQQ
ncbi:MAG: hypothetical protein QXT42_06345 [Thermoplasmata archaeon]